MPQLQKSAGRQKGRTPVALIAAAGCCSCLEAPRVLCRCMAVNNNIFEKISDLFLKYFPVKEVLSGEEAVLVLSTEQLSKVHWRLLCLTSLFNIAIQCFFKREDKINTPIWCNWCNIITPACPGLVCYFLSRFMRRVLKSRNWVQYLIQIQGRGLGWED